MLIKEVDMQSKIENFVHDLYADIDTCEDTKSTIQKYFQADAGLSHFGDIFRGTEEIQDWYDSMKAGFTQSTHQVKSVEYAEFDDVIAVQCDVVWTAGFRNIEGGNMIRYKAIVRMDIVEEDCKLKIRNYKSVAV